MAPRFTVRRQDDGEYYCVWDNETDDVATSADGAFQYINLDRNEAFEEADNLNNPD